MRILPHKPQRSHRSSKRPARGSASGRSKCEVQAPPQIFVRALSQFAGHHYIPAKIRVRRDCYRYLAWRDGEHKREFYLGKIRNCAPQTRSAAGQELAGAGDVDGSRAGVRK